MKMSSFFCLVAGIVLMFMALVVSTILVLRLFAFVAGCFEVVLSMLWEEPKE